MPRLSPNSCLIARLFQESLRQSIVPSSVATAQIVEQRCNAAYRQPGIASALLIERLPRPVSPVLSQVAAPMSGFARNPPFRLPPSIARSSQMRPSQDGRVPSKQVKAPASETPTSFL